MKRRLIIPKRVLEGIRYKMQINMTNYMVFGCDTETYDGEPFLLQINNERNEPKLLSVNSENILDNFLKYIDYVLPYRHTAICFFHNLSFDLVALLKGIDETMFEKTTFKLKRGKWEIEVFCSRTWFAKIKSPSKTIWLIDSKSFIPYSLEKTANDLHIEYKKLPKPVGLGEKKFTLEDKEFVEYAMQDVLIEQNVGEWIINLHRQFNCALSVSLSHLASNIFRTHFLRPEDKIQLPPECITKSAILSYHGGKNGLYIKGGFYENVSEVDINSAYPYAMKNLPSFLKGKYVKVDKFVKNYVGIYCISGKSNCPYNITFDTEFKPVKEFENIWITSYELEQGLKYDEIKLTNIWGYIWEPSNDRNPFGEYVDYFYKLKNETPKTNAMYTFYKLLLNSLYGKLIQMTELDDNEMEQYDYETYINSKGEIKVKRVNKTFMAGGIFNPFIATLITGKTRAMIHELEHKFKAIHTATDSIKTFEKVEGETNELGGYKLEVKGDCLIVRNKLYLHFNEKRELKKYALHGFQGNVLNVLYMYYHKITKYKIKKMIRVREALVQNKKSLVMEILDRTLDVKWEDINYKEVDWSLYTYKDKPIIEYLKQMT